MHENQLTDILVWT